MATRHDELDRLATRTMSAIVRRAVDIVGAAGEDVSEDAVISMPDLILLPSSDFWFGIYPSQQENGGKYG